MGRIITEPESNSFSLLRIRLFNTLFWQSVFINKFYFQWFSRIINDSRNSVNEKRVTAYVRYNENYNANVIIAKLSVHFQRRAIGRSPVYLILYFYI